MRVITGSARGRKLKTPQTQKIRPTSEMVKEAVFSILNFELEGAAVLDLFAGSGQMGIEAISRGAASVAYCDNSREAQLLTNDNINSTELSKSAQFYFMDYKAFLTTTDRFFDIAIIDPPYEKGMAEAALPLVVKRMNAGGVIICETDKTEQLPSEVENFKLHKEYKYGKIKLTVYRNYREE